MELVESFAGAPGPDVFLAPVLEATKNLITGRELRERIEAEVGRLA